MIRITVPRIFSYLISAIVGGIGIYHSFTNPLLSRTESLVTLAIGIFMIYAFIDVLRKQKYNRLVETIVSLGGLYILFFIIFKSTWTFPR